MGLAVLLFVIVFAWRFLSEVAVTVAMWAAVPRHRQLLEPRAICGRDASPC